MGFSNPPVPWEDLARALEGRAPRGGNPRGRIRTVPVDPDRRDVDPAGGPSYLPPPDPTDADPVGADADIDAADAKPIALVSSPTPGRVPYAELHCHSAFSFLDGAAMPEQLVAEAARLGLDALALTDRDGLYGVVRFAEAAREVGLKTLYGAELSLDLPAPHSGRLDPSGRCLLVIARGLEGYRRLSRSITNAQLAGGEKGRPAYDLDALSEAAGGHWLILSSSCGTGRSRTASQATLQDLIDRFGRDNVAVELTTHANPTDDENNDARAALAATLDLPIVATAAARYAAPDGFRLAAAMAATRGRRSLTDADPYLPAGPGAHLRSGTEMAELFARYPEAVATAARLGAECAFDLHLAAPSLPPYPVPDGYDEPRYLRELVMAGARKRYGTPADNPKAYAQIERELAMITQLDFPGYFLIVWDIVQFCRRSNILCQGRGSAANSAVCYALGITAVDAVGYGLLFERFLSPVREGPPDIDVDIEARRREEVIQYVYATYGRDRAAQVANVATYRSKMAVRDMAGALGYSPGQRDAYAKGLSRWGSLDDDTRETAIGSAADPTERRAGTGRHTGAYVAEANRTDEIPGDIVHLARQIQDFPRHLGIHSGGMVICDRPVADVCPVEWARKENRSVLQWDKDDCAAMGLVKFDLLGLGMLSAIHEALDLVRDQEGVEIDLAALDLEEPAVYEMLRQADAVGVFQVESRAQLATLPRLKPERFYDLVIEIALIRPGPIQGGSVHPYLARRDAVRAGTWKGPLVEHPAMERSLGKTLGIPLFQEQLMELAIDVAGFDAGQADQLRKAMGSKRSVDKMRKLKAALYQGMSERNGITGDLADSIFERLQAFANFGFAESHALSFASLVFYSAYLKLHHPAAFLAGLLRAQPMGFYSPQSLVADARRHGVVVHRAHVNHSGAQASLEAAAASAVAASAASVGSADTSPAVRLGLAGVRGIGTELAEVIVRARPEGGYRSLVELTLAVQRAGQRISAAQVEALAMAGAVEGLSGSTGRRAALWAAGVAAARRPDMLPDPADSGSPSHPDGTSRQIETSRSAASRRPAARAAPGIFDVDAPTLPGMSDLELTLADIWATGISPDTYPTAFSRERLTAMSVAAAADLYRIDPGTRIHVAGIVTHRQRPSTAGGVTFLNLEDETGMVNVICQPGLWARYRAVAQRSRSILVRGIIERDRGSLSILADRLAAIEMAGALPSRDFK